MDEQKIDPPAAPTGTDAKTVCTCRHDSGVSSVCAVHPTGTLLLDEQERVVKNWAADDRLWTTQEVVEFNLRLLVRLILKLERNR